MTLKMVTKYNYGTIHRLKTHPDPFNAVINNQKHGEIRKADRDFKVGDILILEEFDPENQQYTGFLCSRQITHILKGGQYGVEPGHVLLSIIPF